MCLMLPWRVTRILDSERAVVASGGDLMEVNRSTEPVLDMGDHVLIASGYVVRRLDPDVAAEIAAILGESEAR